MKWKPARICIRHEHEAHPLRIVGDGAIARHEFGDGRLIPVVILDVTDRLDVAELIRIHTHLESGDAGAQWGQLPGHADTVALYLSFVRPVELVAIIEFDLNQNHGILIDQILSAHGLYIQAGKPGDRIKNTLDFPRIIVEVPDTGFLPTWNELYHRHISHRLRKEGHSRAQAKDAARLAINEMRRFGQNLRSSSRTKAGSE